MTINQSGMVKAIQPPKHPLPNLASNFIWLSSSFTIDKAQTMLMPIVVNQRSFFQDAYCIKPTIWVDRDVDAQTRQYLCDHGVDICSIYSLFDPDKLQKICQLVTGANPGQSSADTYSLNAANLHELRSQVAFNSGLTSPIISRAELTSLPLDRGIIATDPRLKQTTNEDIAQALPLAQRLQPNPALAADIIKILLGLLQPGLYTDIGLRARLLASDDNSKKWSSTSDRYLIDPLTGRFQEELALTATTWKHDHDLVYDLQIIYTTDDVICRSLLLKMLHVLSVGREKTFGITMDTYGTTANKGRSYTFGVWKRVITEFLVNRPPQFEFNGVIYKKHYQDELVKKLDFVPPRLSHIPIGDNYDFMGLAFKQRYNHQLIVDYRALYNDEQVRAMLQKKGGDDMKILDNNHAAKQQATSSVKTSPTDLELPIKHTDKIDKITPSASRSWRRSQDEVEHPSGSKYIGGCYHDDLVNHDVANGNGIIKFSNGDIFKGHFINDQAHGIGDYTFAHNNLTIHGFWEHGTLMFGNLTTAKGKLSHITTLPKTTIDYNGIHIQGELCYLVPGNAKINRIIGSSTDSLLPDDAMKMHDIKHDDREEPLKKLADMVNKKPDKGECYFAKKNKTAAPLSDQQLLEHLMIADMPSNEADFMEYYFPEEAKKQRDRLAASSKTSSV